MDIRMNRDLGMDWDEIPDVFYCFINNNNNAQQILVIIYLQFYYQTSNVTLKEKNLKMKYKNSLKKYFILITFI